MTPISFLRRNRGFSLVELMVAMAIGLFLTLVIAQLFLGSKQSYRTQDDMSRLQENARYAVTLLSRQLRAAGFKSDPAATTSVIFASPILAIQGTDGGGSASDILILRFQGSGVIAGAADNTVIDCLGNAITANAMAYNRFYIQNDAANNNEPTLYCDNTDDGVANGTPLVPGVENMQILFGQDGSGDYSADRYLTAVNVTNMDEVVSVRVALLFRSGPEISTLTDTKTYSLAGTVFDPADDRRVRRIFTTVVNLRNRTL